jgi:hypothetical protein
MQKAAQGGKVGKMEKPLSGGYGVSVEFTDYMLWKLIAVGVIAFCYRFWRAATGRRGPPGED